VRCVLRGPADPRTRTFSIEVTVSKTRKHSATRHGRTLMALGVPLKGHSSGGTMSEVVASGPTKPERVWCLRGEQRGDQFFARARTVELGGSHGK